MEKKFFDFIFSLGAACSCTELLRSLNLQQRSYPFDWISGSNIEERVEILTNGFNNFLNIEDLEYHGLNPYINTIMYKNIRNNLLFVHDFLQNQDLVESFPSVSEKYQRRIQYLYDRIEHNSSTLIVYLQKPDQEPQKGIELLLIKSYSKLIKRWPNKDITLLYFENDQNSVKPVLHDITEKIFLFTANYTNYQANAPHIPNLNLLQVLLTYAITNCRENKNKWENLDNFITKYYSDIEE